MSARSGIPERPLPLIAEALLFCAVMVAAVAGAVSMDAPAPPGGAALDRSRLRPAFAEDFAKRPAFWDRVTAPNGRWKTNYWFGVQETTAEKGWEPRTLQPNGELQYYGDPANGMSPFEWQPGVLTIAAKPNPFAADPVTHHLPYLSGVITTEKSFAFTYGYVETRVAFPSRRGIWPAFWLLPLPKIVDGQPQNPGTAEIDVFESIGEPGRLYFTFFPTLPDGEKKGDQIALDSGLDLSQFHTYGLLVTPKLLAWYLDGREVRRVANRDFHRPMFLMLNLAIGGKWASAPAPDTPWPMRMRIDWVRGYRLKGATA